MPCDAAGAAAVGVTGRPSAALEMTQSEMLRADPEIWLAAGAAGDGASGPAVVVAVGVCGGVWSRVNVMLLSDVSGDVLWLLC